MCIIVDANKLGNFLAEPANDDAAPIREWLDRGEGSIFYSTGGKFTKEIGKEAKIRLQNYSRNGKAKLFPASKFEQDLRDLQAQGGLRSNDPHILALARASGARLLYTGDQDLIEDFKNKRFIDQPRGKIYSGAANANLLTKSICTA